MRNGWRQCTLDEVLTLQRGFDLPERERRPGAVPIISSSGVTGYHDTARVRAPGVVTGRYGTLGDVFYVTEDFWPLNTALYVRDFKGNDPRFIGYFLRTLNLARQNVAGAVPGVNRNVLHMLAVSIPPLPLQRIIASILAAYDDLIENNTRRIANLEERARLLYDEWFVRFRFPGHERVRLVESELGMVPQGWKIVKLGDVIEFAYGKALKAQERMPGSVPVYGSSGIVGYHAESLVRGPGVIVGRKGNVGTVYWSETNFYPIDTVFYVRTDLSLPYVYYNLQRQRFLNSDAAVPGLRRAQAYLLDLLKPSDELLRKFEQWARPLFREKSLLERTNVMLRRTRDRLLPGLIAGEIDVSGWIESKEPTMVEVAVQRAGSLRHMAEAAGEYEPGERAGVEWKSLWELR